MKIAFTGTHGTGKTTSVFEYAHKMKIEYPNQCVGIFHENAAQAPKGLFNKNGTELSQLWIFANQLEKEIFMGYNYDILICDRTIFDSIAYSIYLKFDFTEKLFQLALEFLPTYDKIYFKQIQTNNFWFNCKHRETSDIEYRQQIENILMKLYKRTGITKTDKFQII